MNGEHLYVENSSISKVLSIGKVMLKKTSRKLFTLIICFMLVTLVSNSLLSKKYFKMVFKSDKFILSKDKIFLRKWYHNNSLLKINVMIVIINDDDDDTFFSNLFEFYDMWHDRLGHVNYNFMQKLINLELLLSIIFEKNHKFLVCI